MKNLKFIAYIFLICCAFSCTDNQRVKVFGGIQEIKLKPNEVLLNTTWKETSLWVLTEDTLTHIKYFRETSAFGIWEGEIVFK